MQGCLLGNRAVAGSLFQTSALQGHCRGEQGERQPIGRRQYCQHHHRPLHYLTKNHFHCRVHHRRRRCCPLRPDEHAPEGCPPSFPPTPRPAVAAVAALGERASCGGGVGASWLPRLAGLGSVAWCRGRAGGRGAGQRRTTPPRSTTATTTTRTRTVKGLRRGIGCCRLDQRRPCRPRHPNPAGCSRNSLLPPSSRLPLLPLLRALLLLLPRPRPLPARHDRLLCLFLECPLRRRLLG
mmetsp:Transcript_41708/g.70934  ORF Transcript_41708/g.70934 Transcript_41708/m.70934 type:complete len:238 (-) Transcript_41708:245-958(-)